MTRTKELSGVGFMIRALIHCAEASVLWEQIGKSCEERLGTCWGKVGKSWEKLWTKLGKGWEKGRERSSGTKLRKGWAQVGNRLGTSWEKVGSSLGVVENREKLGTSWEALGKQLGNGCEQVGMRISSAKTFSDMSGKAAAVRALQGWHCPFCFGGASSL